MQHLGTEHWDGTSCANDISSGGWFSHWVQEFRPGAICPVGRNSYAEWARSVLPRRAGRWWSNLSQQGRLFLQLPAFSNRNAQVGVAFLDLLSKELYRDFPFHEVVSNEDQRRELVKFVQDSNSTMRSVAALCARKVSDTEFVSNEMMRAW